MGLLIKFEFDSFKNVDTTHLFPNHSTLPPGGTYFKNTKHELNSYKILKNRPKMEYEKVKEFAITKAEIDVSGSVLLERGGILFVLNEHEV